MSVILLAGISWEGMREGGIALCHDWTDFVPLGYEQRRGLSLGDSFTETETATWHNLRVKNFSCPSKQDNDTTPLSHFPATLLPCVIIRPLALQSSHDPAARLSAYTPIISYPFPLQSLLIVPSLPSPLFQLFLALRPKTTRERGLRSEKVGTVGSFSANHFFPGCRVAKERREMRAEAREGNGECSICVSLARAVIGGRCNGITKEARISL